MVEVRRRYDAASYDGTEKSAKALADAVGGSVSWHNDQGMGLLTNNSEQAILAGGWIVWQALAGGDGHQLVGVYETRRNMDEFWTAVS
jgi:hypothetical protein